MQRGPGASGNPSQTSPENEALLGKWELHRTRSRPHNIGERGGYQMVIPVPALDAEKSETLFSSRVSRSLSLTIVLRNSR